MSALPQSRNDVAAMRDLAQLTKDPSAGQAMASDTPGDAEGAARGGSGGGGAGVGGSSMPAALPDSQDGGAGSMKAADAADQGLFSVWEQVKEERERERERQRDRETERDRERESFVVPPHVFRCACAACMRASHPCTTDLEL